MGSPTGGANHTKQTECTCRFCGGTFIARDNRASVCFSYDCGEKAEIEQQLKARKRANDRAARLRAERG